MIIILSIAAVAVTFAFWRQSRYLESVTIPGDPHEFEDA